MEVKFYDYVEDGLLKFAVIVSRSDGKWVFCKHRERVRCLVGIAKQKNRYWILQKEN